MCVLQVLVGSHKAGRIDHWFDGGQQGADRERVEHLKKVYDHFYINLQPGEATSLPNLVLWLFNCLFRR